MEEKNQENLIQQKSPQGEFLQSSKWREFQESVGRKTFEITSSALRAPSPYKGEGDFYFHASIIEHNLPVVGGYFYIPKGPIFNFQFSIFKQFSNSNDQISKQIQELIDLAKENKVGWIRIEPESQEILEMIKDSVSSHLTPALSSGRRGGYKVIKAPHDMQPKETFIIDITKSEEELLKEMKSKTRYNIKLAGKKGVNIKIIDNIEEFLRLNKIMAARQEITTHNDQYYKRMLGVIPENMFKLYVAEHGNKIIAANIMVFYGDTATYLHGASDDEYRNVMATYLLQWRQIQDARKAGCAKYDFGGVKTQPHPNPLLSKERGNIWQGITRFKLGFSPNTESFEFPGSYDIIVSPVRYRVYRIIQKIKSFIG